MSITRTAVPSAEPVTRVEAKLHLRIDHTDEDATIDDLIRVARDLVEHDTGRALITQTWVLRLDAFPDTIELPRPPLQSVTSVEYVDTAGDTQTLTADTDYTVDKYPCLGRIVPAYAQSWPTTRDVVNAVVVTYVAGYGDNARDVPQPLQQAMKLLIGEGFENREAATVLPAAARMERLIGEMAYERLVARYRVPRV